MYRQMWVGVIDRWTDGWIWGRRNGLMKRCYSATKNVVKTKFHDFFQLRQRKGCSPTHKEDQIPKWNDVHRNCAENCTGFFQKRHETSGEKSKLDRLEVNLKGLWSIPWNIYHIFFSHMAAPALPSAPPSFFASFQKYFWSKRINDISKL